MKVEDVIQGQKVVTADIEQTVGEVADLMQREGITGVPIVDGFGALAGLVTVSRVVEIARASHDASADLPLEPNWSPSQRTHDADSHWRRWPVKDVMVTELVTVRRDTPVAEAAKTLCNAQVHRAVVLGDDRNVCGVISSLDFTRLVAQSNIA